MAEETKVRPPTNVDEWRPASARPSEGAMIVAFFEREATVWAGRYWGVKQSFSHWRPLELPNLQQRARSGEQGVESPRR